MIEINPEEEFQYIQSETGFSEETINAVLSAQYDFLVEKGVYTPIEE